MADAFAHNAWATLRLIESCGQLTNDQLASAAPGTYGAILATLRHLVGDECFDLWVLTNEMTELHEAETMSLQQLSAESAANGDHWQELLAGHPDPGAEILEVDPGDGFRRTAPLGIRLAQALHHASEHRTQVSVALASLGLQSPDLSAFRFGTETGRVAEEYPTNP